MREMLKEIKSSRKGTVRSQLGTPEGCRKGEERRLNRKSRSSISSLFPLLCHACNFSPFRPVQSAAFSVHSIPPTHLGLRSGPDSHAARAGGPSGGLK